MSTSKADDQAYLREVQYKDGGNLTSRADLHTKYGTAAIGWYEWVAARVDWRTAADVLEVGCGTGAVWPAINAVLPHAINLTLTDLSPGMLAEAAARVAGLASAVVARAEVADVQALPFDDASFDVVIANHMLYHAPDRGQAARELRRVLRRDGTLIAATNGSDHMKELGEIRTAVLGGAVGPEYTRRFGRENGAEILGEFFDAVEWYGYPDELRCTDADDVVAYIVSMSPGEIGAEAQASLRDAVLERFVGGALKVTKDSGVFIARPNATA